MPTNRIQSPANEFVESFHQPRTRTRINQIRFFNVNTFELQIKRGKSTIKTEQNVNFSINL